MKAQPVMLAAWMAGALSLLMPGMAIGASTGALTQKAGTAGCISETGSGGACQDGLGLDLVLSPVISPDGLSAYATSVNYNAVTVFDRNPATGALTQKPGKAGCISDSGTGGLCEDAKALDNPIAVTVSPDGRNVYVAAQDSGAIAIFDRDATTGALTQKAGTGGCASDDGSGGTCQDSTAVGGAFSVAVSHDGRQVYAGSLASDAVAVFDRDAATGALTQKPGTAGCVSETGNSGACQNGVALDGVVNLAESPDGKNLYATALTSQAVVSFTRDPVTGEIAEAGCISETGTGGACSDGFALATPFALVAGGDGRNVYVVTLGSSSLVTFTRDPGTGALTEAGCVSDTGTAGACQDGVALDGLTGIAASPDGRTLYATAAGADSVAVFTRDVATGTVAQKAGTAGCVSDTGTGGACADGTGFDGARGAAVSPDGRQVYVAAGNSDAITVLNRGVLSSVLAQKAGKDGCVSETGTAGACADGQGLGNAVDTAVSPDGRNLYVAASSSDSVAVFDRDPATGTIAQKAGTAGCISEKAGPCAPGRALNGAFGVVVSPDGRNVYVASLVAPGGIAIFDRNLTTGALTQKPGIAGCVTETGSGGACQDGAAVDGLLGIAVSPDGRSVYAAAWVSDDGGTLTDVSAVAVLDRDPATGALTQKAGTAGCWSETGTGGTCQNGVALARTTSVAVSPDGRQVYATAETSDAVAIFDRDPATGALTQKAGTAGCISQTGTGGACQDGAGLDAAQRLTLSRDGRSLYATAYQDDAVAIFDRNRATGELTQKAGTAACVSETGSGGDCQDGTALDGPVGIVGTPDGRSVYLATELSGAMVGLDRDPATGALAPRAGKAGCVSETGSGGACQDGTAVAIIYGVTVSPDGRTIYAGDYNSSAVAVLDTALDRPPACSAATVAVAHDTATTVTLTCTDPDLDSLTLAIATAPGKGALGTVDQAGKTVRYTPAAGSSGKDTFTFRASDGDNTSPPATITLDVAAAPSGGGGGGGGGDGGGDAVVPQPPAPSTQQPAGTGAAPVTTSSSSKPTPPPAATLTAGPAGSAPPAFGASGVIAGLPSTRRCLSRRSFRIHIRERKGRTYAVVTVFVNAKRVRTVRGKRISAPVDLRGLPRGRFTVKIVILTTIGEVIQGRRTYRTCEKRRPGGSRPKG